MAEIEMTYGVTSKTLQPVSARIVRRESARKYIFHNGGWGKKRLGAEFVLDLKWEAIDSTSYDDLAAVLDAIRSGTTVQISDTDGLSYAAADLVGASVDIDDDEILEQDFELFEKMPMQVKFVTSRVQAWRESAKDDSWTWGSTDTTFDDVSDKTFDEYN